MSIAGPSCVAGSRGSPIFSVSARATSRSTNGPTAPFSTIGVIRYGMNDSSVGKFMFLSSGQPADRILSVCKDGDLCEVSGTARGEEIAKVAKAVRVGRFADPAAPLRWVYSHYKDDRGSFWLEDDDLESLFTPRMAALVVKTRRAAQILEEETAEPSWIGSQDWLIRDLKIDAREQGPGRAVATMTYRNMIEQNPKPHSTRFDIVLTDAGWRIDEVRTQPDPGEKPARTRKTGSEVMKENKDRLAYVYEDVADGGRVRITTRVARTLMAVHEFLRFQITDHKTGDSLDVTRQ